ncbi:MAG: YtxH domain-containing protein [Lewinellaceae bacterium]|jgi:gas vesicle protein|nr:YtxH domain-containing protein [Lewinellaceae bacterium]
MEKRNTIELLLAGAILGGAFYFLFFTERGNQFRERMIDVASDKLDDLLESLEKELSEMEMGVNKISETKDLI